VVLEARSGELPERMRNPMLISVSDGGKDHTYSEPVGRVGLC